MKQKERYQLTLIKKNNKKTRQPQFSEWRWNLCVDVNMKKC